MKTYCIEFTDQEEKLFVEGLRSNLSSISWTLIQKAYKRGGVKVGENKKKGKK